MTQEYSAEEQRPFTPEQLGAFLHGLNNLDDSKRSGGPTLPGRSAPGELASKAAVVGGKDVVATGEKTERPYWFSTRDFAKSFFRNGNTWGLGDRVPLEGRTLAAFCELATRHHEYGEGPASAIRAVGNKVLAGDLPKLGNVVTRNVPEWGRG